MRITAINHDLAKTAPLEFGCDKAQKAIEFHKTLAGYHPTPLVTLDGLAKAAGVRKLYVKDESKRFGLNAFKALGGSYAMHCLLDGREECCTFVTATDGNHGRGVAWAAKMLGQKAVVFMPKGSSQERLENILKLGAVAEITEYGYDDCVRYARKMAEKNGWLLLQDTAWQGYETIPAMIMQGYTTMGLEIMEQLGDVVPTHIFLQAGVGAMAGAMTSFFADCYKEKRPRIVIVEPDGADCIFRTAEAGDGMLHFCKELSTMMAGLSCGEPCTIGWDIIERYADFAMTCPDSVAADGMRILANPVGNDSRIISGESGAVTVGAVARIMHHNAPMQELLGLTADSVILCISTEGDTDRENYQKIVGCTASCMPGNR